MTAVQQMEAKLAEFKAKLEEFKNEYAEARGVSKDDLFNKS